MRLRLGETEANGSPLPSIPGTVYYDPRPRAYKSNPSNNDATLSLLTVTMSVVSAVRAIVLSASGIFCACS